jgi:hypothetical protein
MSNLARDFMNSDAVVGVARRRRIGITNNNPQIQVFLRNIWKVAAYL